MAGVCPCVLIKSLCSEGCFWIAAMHSECLLERPWPLTWHAVEMKLANLSKRSCRGRISLERRKCDEILTKCHFPAAYKLVSSLWAVQCKHLNNRKLDWRETAARNKALYIFSLIQRHPPGKLGVHSCVVNKIAKWQHDRMIETLIERLKRGEAEGERKAMEMQASFSSEKLQRYEPIYVHKRLSSVVLAVRAQKRCSIQARPIITWIILPIKPIKQSFALCTSEIFLSVTHKALNTELCWEAFWVVFLQISGFSP